MDGDAVVFKRAVFFRELYDGDPRLSSLYDSVRPVAHPDEDRIVAYLKMGVGLAGIGKYVGDVLNPNARFAVSPSLLSDGVW